MSAKDLSLGLQFFYRVLLPGSVLATVSSPLALRYLELFGVKVGDAQGWLLAAYAVILGVLISALGDTIYKICEGRIGWPPRLSRFFTNRWKLHVGRVFQLAEAARARGDKATYDELWFELRQFPTDDNGNPTANRPTKMGNILAGYEDYPERRYGMDSVFYWYRLWLRLDKDVREEIDKAWASTDALMYLAGGSVAVGVMYVLSALVAWALSIAGYVWLSRDATERLLFLIWGAVLIAVSYVPYRSSISGHLTNGENYKSVFDVFRFKVLPDMRPADALERARWRQLWGALQYGEEEKAPEDNNIRNREPADARGADRLPPR